MAKLVIYRDYVLKESVIVGVSKSFPNNYELSYTDTNVIIKSLQTDRNDVHIAWQEITDHLGTVFTTFDELKAYLAIVFEHISWPEPIPGPPGPPGDKGEDGKSAYDVWIEEGNEGSPADFIESLKGVKGDDGYTPIKGTDYFDGEKGEDGLSVYDLWLSLGNIGTVQQFLDSLKGDKGDKGADGDDADTSFGNYLKWILKVNSEERGVDIEADNVLDLISGENVSIEREGKNVTFSSSDTNNYLSSVTLNEETGDITFAREGLEDIILNLDARYVQEFLINVEDTNDSLDKHEIAVVADVKLFETITELVTPILSGNTLTLRYKNESGVVQSIDLDLSSLAGTLNISIEDATWDPLTSTITLTETDGTVHTISLSDFNITTVVNPDGTVNILQGGVSKITISAVGITGDYNDLLNKPPIPAELIVNDTNTNLDRHKIGDVKGVNLYETVTALITPTIVGNILTLKYRNENNIEQTVTVDLSGIITTDINVDDIVYNAATNIITLTETDGTPHSINLSEFSLIVTIDGNGNAIFTQEGVVKITISKLAISGHWDDIIGKPEIDNELKIYQIPLEELSAAPTDETIQALVAEWFNNQGIIKLDIQTIGWETIGEIIVVSAFTYTFPYQLT